MPGLWIDAQHAQCIEGLASHVGAFVLDQEELSGMPCAGVGADPRHASTFGVALRLLWTALGGAFGSPAAQEHGKSIVLLATCWRRFMIARGHTTLLSSHCACAEVSGCAERNPNATPLQQD